MDTKNPQLKTLKDLDEESGGDYDTDDIINAVHEWIKELEKYYLGGYTFGDKWYGSDEGINIATGWIRHFFNLEDD